MSVTILTHADCDGMCAGAIAMSKYPEARVFFTRPTSLLEDLRETKSEKIIICDIALTKQDARQIVAAMAAKDADIYYFDHHIIPKTLKKQDIKKACRSYVHDVNQSASELAYRHYQKDIPRERIWIALYGAIGDYADDTPFVKERILNWDRRALFFEVSTIVLGIKNEEFSSYDAKREIVRVLSEGNNPSDIPGLVKSAKDAVNREFDMYEMLKGISEVSGDVAFVKDKPSFGFRGPAALFTATIRDKPVGMCVHTREGYIDITMRKRSRKYRLNELAEVSAEYVKGSGGGHPEAAGCKIPLDSFQRFLKKLNKEMDKAER